jgi:hypothetical protein
VRDELLVTLRGVLGKQLGAFKAAVQESVPPRECVVVLGADLLPDSPAAYVAQLVRSRVPGVLPHGPAVVVAQTEDVHRLLGALGGPANAAPLEDAPPAGFVWVVLILRAGSAALLRRRVVANAPGGLA